MLYLAVSSLIGLGSLCFPDVVFAGFLRQTIQNNTGQDVNDVRVTFDNQTREARLTTRTEPPRTQRGGLSSDLTQATFAQNTFGTLADKGKVDIDFDNSRTTIIDNPASRITSGRWTEDGNDIGNITIAGEPLRLSFNLTTGEAIVTVSNHDPFPIMYSDIAFFVDNDNANFNIDNFLVPTGTSVPGLPTSITLSPSGSTTFSFELSDPRDYVLGLANVASIDDPNNFFAVATAEVAEIPEPGTLMLFSTGILGLLGYSWQRRKPRL